MSADLQEPMSADLHEPMSADLQEPMSADLQEPTSAPICRSRSDAEPGAAETFGGLRRAVDVHPGGLLTAGDEHGEFARSAGQDGLRLPVADAHLAQPRSPDQHRDVELA